MESSSFYLRGREKASPPVGSTESGGWGVDEWREAGRGEVTQGPGGSGRTMDFYPNHNGRPLEGVRR